MGAGGLLAARALIRILSRKGVTLNGLIPTNHEDTSADEVVSYALAGLGFYFQFKYGLASADPWLCVHLETLSPCLMLVGAWCLDTSLPLKLLSDSTDVVCLETAATTNVPHTHAH